MRPIRHIAVVVPCLMGTEQGKTIVQDRRGYKPPLWGYFGGGMEQGETPLEAIVREIREELDFEVNPQDLQLLGVCTGALPQMDYTIHVFKLPFAGDPAVLNVLEGAGLDVVTPEEMLTRCAEGGPDHQITQMVMDHFAAFSGTDS